MKSILRLLELFLRHVIVYPFFRLFFRNSQNESPINIRSIKKILILRYDRIGDIIVTTPIFAKLKRENPNLQVGIFASPSNASIVQHDPNIDRIYVLHSNWIKLYKEVLLARKERYDVVLNFIFNRTTSGGLLANLIAPTGHKVGQGAEKYRFYFNRLLQLPRGSRHMIEVLASFVTQVFGFAFDDSDYRFRIVIDSKSQDTVDRFLKQNYLMSKAKSGDVGSPFAVFNLSATDSVRKISFRQAQQIVNYLTISKNLFTILIASPKDAAFTSNVIATTDTMKCIPFPESGIASLLEIASLIEGAAFVITPDTSIIHFTSAMQTPVIGLFTPIQVTTEWMPYKVKNQAIYASEGSPVSSIPIDQIQEGIDRFLTELQLG